MNFKLLPHKSIALKQQYILGLKKRKQRITVLSYRNTCGTHLLSLLCIEKTKNLKALTNVLLLTYKN